MGEEAMKQPINRPQVSPEDIKKLEAAMKEKATCD
jgi:hypothetical protein